MTSFIITWTPLTSLHSILTLLGMGVYLARIDYAQKGSQDFLRSN